MSSIYQNITYKPFLIIGLTCTNWANELGHSPVGTVPLPPRKGEEKAWKLPWRMVDGCCFMVDVEGKRMFFSPRNHDLAMKHDVFCDGKLLFNHLKGCFIETQWMVKHGKIPLDYPPKYIRTIGMYSNWSLWQCMDFMIWCCQIRVGCNHNQHEGVLLSARSPNISVS